MGIEVIAQNVIVVFFETQCILLLLILLLYHTTLSYHMRGFHSIFISSGVLYKVTHVQICGSGRCDIMPVELLLLQWQLRWLPHKAVVTRCPCSDFRDMLRCLRNCCVVIIIKHSTENSSVFGVKEVRINGSEAFLKQFRIQFLQLEGQLQTGTH